MNEKISQLIDQELSSEQRNELLEQLINDEAGSTETITNKAITNKARKSWKCYHLIGNVIRAEVASTGKDLSELVRAQLAKEPTVLAPLNINNAFSNDPTSSTTSSATTSSAGNDLWKSVGLFAIAASLVVVAVVTLTPLKLTGVTHQLTANGKAFNSSQATQFYQEFDEMLVKHAEFTASPAMNGLIAYAKLVSAEQPQQ